MVRARKPKLLSMGQSTMAPLPFWPNLRRALRSNGAALLLTYFEVHYPVPQDNPNGRVLVDIDRTLLDLQLYVTDFWRYAGLLTARYQSEAKLAAARRTGREFHTLQRHHSGALKPYSFTTITRERWILRRNWPVLLRLLRDTAVITPEQFERVDGFRALREHFERETGRKFALALAGELLDAVDPGRKHAFAERRVWSEERRAKFKATIAARKLKNPYIDQR